MSDYQRRISYNGPRGMSDLFPEIRNLLERVMMGLQMTQLAENVLQIDYPAELVQQIRMVDVDDAIFRLDFILVGYPDDRYCFFPFNHWNRDNFFLNRRFDRIVREESNGRLTLTCPELD